MGLSSIFQRKSPQPAAGATARDTPADLVQQARTKARRRLIGAVVLVVVGVIGFPILFETQPRPIPVDIPIEIPRKDSVPPLAMPAARPARPVAATTAEPPSAPRAAGIVTETPDEGGREVPPPAKAASASARSAAAESRTADKEPAAQDAREARDTREAKEAAKEARETKDAPKDAGRYVVQVGAFTDSAAARETRQKVERLGLKTFTQVTETAQGNRIRVRIGPFASREEADRVLARLKAAGSPAVVLTL